MSEPIVISDWKKIILFADKVGLFYAGPVIGVSFFADDFINFPIPHDQELLGCLRDSDIPEFLIYLAAELEAGRWRNGLHGVFPNGTRVMFYESEKAGPDADWDEEIPF